MFEIIREFFFVEVRKLMNSKVEIGKDLYGKYLIAISIGLLASCVLKVAEAISDIALIYRNKK